MKKILTFALLTLAIIATMVVGASAEGTPSDWAVEEIDLAKEAGLITAATTKDYQAAITREQFCELVVKLYEKLTNSKATPAGDIFTDTDNPEILKAYNLGIVKGVSATSFAPYNKITRQEICVMLTRCINVAVDGADINDYYDSYFADEDEIASWAIDSVKYASTQGIMYGTGGGYIVPLGNATCEQAIMLAYRIFDNKEALSYPKALFMIVQNGKYGLMNREGEIVIEPKYDSVSNFWYGLAIVEIDGKYGFINKQGEIVIEAKFEDVHGFNGSTGMAEAKLNGKWGYIDREGNFVIEPKFDMIYGICIGLDKVYTKVGVDDKYGYIDDKGNYVIEPKFEDIGDNFYAGITPASLDGDKYGYIDKTGTFVIEPQFDDADDFINGCARVYIGEWREGKCGIIDLEGNWVIEPEFDDIFDDYGEIIRVLVGDKVALVDENGDYIVEPKYENIDFFNDDIAAFKLGDKWGYMDFEGNVIIEPKYDEAEYFEGGVAEIWLDGKCGCIDKKGNVVIPIIYDNILRYIHDELIMVEIDGKFGVIDRNGNLVIPIVYNDISHFDEGMAIVIRDGKYGIIDEKGNIVIPIEYEYINGFENGLAIVELDDNSIAYINKKGEIVYINHL